MATKLTNFEDALQELYRLELIIHNVYTQRHLNTEKFAYVLNRLEELADKLNIKLEGR